MSIKIYNGYRLPMLSFAELQLLIGAVQEKIHKEHIRIYHRKVGAIVTDILDNKFLLGSEDFAKSLSSMDGGYGLDHSALSIAFLSMTCHQDAVRKTMIRDPGYDFSCSMLFIPSGDFLLMMLYTERDEFVSIVDGFDEITRYPYWNNTDRPDDLTDEEWDNRRKDWGPAIEASSPSKIGFSIELTGDFDVVISDGDLLENIHTFDDRVSNRAKMAAIEEIVSEKVSGERDRITPSVYVRAMASLDTEDGRLRLDRHKAHFRELLPSSYTINDMKRRLDAF